MNAQSTGRPTDKSRIKRSNIKGLSRLAFTLAEVLITLGIIGIVAEETIPVVLNNTKNLQYVTGVKKFYDNFNQVLQQISADNGCIGNLACTGLFATGTTDQTLGDALVKYLNVAKNCGANASQGCWAAGTNYSYDGTGVSNNYDADVRYKFITTDGMSVWVQNYASTTANCGTNLSTGALGYMSQICGFVRVDVNGPKGPNYMGRDTYTFAITNGKGTILYPKGGIDDNNGGNSWWNGASPSCQTGHVDGRWCPGRIMEESWKMNY